MTITEFLLQCIGQDEEVAREAVERNGGVWTVESLEGWDDSDNCRINGTVEPSNPRAYSGDRQLWDDEGALGMFGATAKHIANHDPDRVLRDCKSKRAVIEPAWALEESLEGEYGQGRSRATLEADGEEPLILQLMASVYADRPGYDPKWAENIF